MDRLEDRVDGIETGMLQVDAKLEVIQADQQALGEAIEATTDQVSELERGQIKLTYATIAIADKVGARIQVPQD